MVKINLSGIFSSVLAACFFSLFITSQVFAFSGSGVGSSGNPFQITTCSQLHEIAGNLSANYLLMNDVNCTGFSFAPIGDTTSNFFVGKLDGGGHKITNLIINSNENGVGIFEEIGSGGVITNIGYESGSLIQQGDSVAMGSFAAIVSGGSITKSYSKASLDGSAANFISPVMGGLFGQGNSATVSDSYYSGNIVNATANQNNTGGIAGYMSGGSIATSYSTGSLANGQNVGGITGRLLSSATISNSFSTMTFINDTLVGALVGTLTSGTITNSYWNDTSGGFFTCYFGGNTGCTRITNNIPYFYTISNPPMSSWDFVNNWSTINNSTGYPLLYWQSPNPTPTSTPTPTPVSSNNTHSVSTTASSTPTPPGCGDPKPATAPDLFQIDTSNTKAVIYFSPAPGANKYMISYGYTPGDARFGVEFPQNQQNGVVAYAINGLTPNATYYFRARAGNGCMPGNNWSNEMKITTAKTPSGAITYYKNYLHKLLSFLPAGY